MLPVHHIKPLALILASTFSISTQCWGSEPVTSHHIGAGIELSNWQEYQVNGQRLLSEHGLRLTLQGHWNNILPSLNVAQINVSGRVYNGQLSYDGQTQSSDPLFSGIYIASTSHYLGFTAEIECLKRTHSPSNIALLASLGLDAWRRDIQSSLDSRNNPIGGFSEEYQIAYTRLGLQQQQANSYGHSQSRFGIKYPVYTNERAGGISATLEPGSDWSVFASYRLQLNDARQTTVEFYYDSLRLQQSPVVTDQFGNNWVQPESHQDSFGLQIGIPF